MNEHILIVDDDKAFRIATTALLEDEGYAVRSCGDARDAMPLLLDARYDLLLSDLVMEGMNGIELLQWLSVHAPDTPAIMITGFGSINTAVEAMRLGAFDYITKPCDNAELRVKIRRALDARSRDRELERLRETVRDTSAFGNIVTQNEAMHKVFSLLRRVADTDLTVLLLGETGTGKELAARAVHYSSARRNGPFIVVNCAALPETLLESELFGHERNAFTGALRQRIGKFEEAQGGTVFLDEIGDVPLQMQTKLLRVLQEREIQRLGGNDSIPIDVRVIAATHRDLTAMIAAGEFRADLFYRLNEVPVQLPPLRERRDDLPLLADTFLRKHASIAGGTVAHIHPEALQVMMRYDWPGNVRELENLMKRALVTATGDSILAVDIPVQTHTSPPAGNTNPAASDLPFKEYMRSVVQAAETAFITQALEDHRGNISAVAERMDVDRKTVYRKIEELGIDASRYR
ncbi:MAG: sigma-54-dependent Fis family transcriptional regulator [Ignavibacteriae bacterium]|nr:sigma-54-dependent Fis family transcriptional regulator [Ignavibacteriota bacterium]